MALLSREGQLSIIPELKVAIENKLGIDLEVCVTG
jgi:hypothetical protein